MQSMNNRVAERYTLNDIFTRNYQVWFLASLMIMILTPAVTFAVNSFTIQNQFEASVLIKFFVMSTYPGDFMYEIFRTATLFSIFAAVIGFVSYSAAKKKYSLKTSFADEAPLLFLVTFAVLIIASVIVNKTDRYNITGYSTFGEGALNHIYYVIIFYFAASKVKNPKLKDVVIYTFLIIDVILAILEIIDENWYHMHAFAYDGLGANALFKNCNFYGYYLTIATMLCAAIFVLEKEKNVKKWLALAALVLNSFMINLCNTFGCFLACVVAFIFLLIAVAVRDKKFPLMCIIALVVFFGVNLIAGHWYNDYFADLKTLGGDVGAIAAGGEEAQHAGTDRWSLWTLTWGYIKEKPWFGWGTRGISKRLGDESVNANDVPHNEYLQYGAYYGLPALFFYIAGLVAVVIKAVRKRKYLDNTTLACLTAAFGYMGSAFFGNTIFFVAPFFFIFLGLANVHETDGVIPRPRVDALDLARKFISLQFRKDIRTRD